MNKTYLTVAQIFAIIAGVVCCITIFGIPFGVLNFIAANKLSRAKEDLESRDTVRNWSIYLIFGAGLIAGIAGILASESNKDNFKLEQSSSSSTNSLEEQLTNLEKLYERGLITKEEYDERRKRIIETI